MANADVVQLKHERARLRREKTAMLPLLANAIVHQLPTERYYQALYQELTDRIEVCSWQLAAYEPQQALFLDDTASYPPNT